MNLTTVNTEVTPLKDCKFYSAQQINSEVRLRWYKTKRSGTFGRRSITNHLSPERGQPQP